MRKRSDKEEFEVDFAIFIGVIILSASVILFLFAEFYPKTITGYQIMQACPGLVCPPDYAKTDTNGDGCPDTCSSGGVARIPGVCPAFEGCVSGTPVDSNGDGCPDLCQSSGNQQQTACGNGVCEFGENNSACSKDCPGQPTVNATTQNQTITTNRTNAECIENWGCSKFSKCVGASQSRNCIDNNECGTNINEPSLSQACQETPQDNVVAEIISPKSQNSTNTTASTKFTGPTSAASEQQQQAANSQNSSMIPLLAVLISFFALIGGTAYFILKTIKRKSLIKQLDEILNRATSALSGGDIRSATSNYSVLREYYTTYNCKLSKKDAVRFSSEALRIYNELVVKQKAVASQIA